MNRLSLWYKTWRANKVIQDVYKYIPQGRTVAQLYPLIKAVDTRLQQGSDIAVITDKDDEEFGEAMELMHSMLGVPEDDEPIRMLH